MDELLYAVIHSLEKDSGETEASITTRDEVLDCTKPVVISLAEQLSRLVGKDGSSVYWGQFGNNRREGLFPQSVQGMIPSHSEGAFLAMSLVAMEELEAKARAENFATGGHVCFLVYRSMGSIFLLIAMIKLRGGMILTPELEPTEISEIDLSKLHQAARVNLNRYSEFLITAQYEDQREEAKGVDEQSEGVQEKTYLCFINRKSQDDVSGYFVEALGCEKGVSSGRSTKAVVAAVRKFVKDQNEISDRAASARLAVIEYLQQQDDGAIVKLDTIVAVVRRSMGVDLEHNVDGLKEFLNGEDVRIPDEFPVSTKALKAYTRISGKSDNWNLSFENSALGLRDSELVFDPTEESLKLTRLPHEMLAKVQEVLSARAKLQQTTA